MQGLKDRGENGWKDGQTNIRTTGQKIDGQTNGQTMIRLTKGHTER